MRPKRKAKKVKRVVLGEGYLHTTNADNNNVCLWKSIDDSTRIWMELKGAWSKKGRLIFEMEEK